MRRHSQRGESRACVFSLRSLRSRRSSSVGRRLLVVCSRRLRAAFARGLGGAGDVGWRGAASAHGIRNFVRRVDRP